MFAQKDFEVDPLNVMIQIKPKTIVAKDISFFRTGPDLASSE